MSPTSHRTPSSRPGGIVAAVAMRGVRVCVCVACAQTHECMRVWGSVPVDAFMNVRKSQLCIILF